MVFTAENITSRTLVVAPRLFMTAASLIIDLAVYKICQHLRMDPRPSLCLLSTSFVTLVFSTRTFSNSVESILFASLLLWVISSISNKNTVYSRRDYMGDISIGFVVTVGVWIRPTFLAFACVPLLWWLMDICTLNWTVERNTSALVRHILKPCTFMGVGSVLTIIALTLIDSQYFGYLQNNELVLTPLNFILYNMDSSTLREHGLHPRIMHFAVNLPLLFGPMALGLYAVITNAVIKRKFIIGIKLLLSTRKINKGKIIDNDYKTNFIWSMLLCSIVVSVALLSWIPHQEPRFIIPILLPLIIIFSWCLTGSSITPLAMLSWLIWNILGYTVFGMMHQGGVYPCLAYLQQYLHNARSLQTFGTAYHVTFYHTYMPPQHLLAWPLSIGERHLLHSLDLYDLKGSSKDALRTHLEKLISEESKSHGKKSEIFIICPSTVKFDHPSFTLKQQFYPHLSMEDPPDLKPLFKSAPEETDTCTKGNQGGKYQDPASSKEHCKRGSRETGTNEWRFPYWEIVSSWISSELSLNLYQYVQTNSSVNFKPFEVKG